jgi:hypothetical protein
MPSATSFAFARSIAGRRSRRRTFWRLSSRPRGGDLMASSRRKTRSGEQLPREVQSLLRRLDATADTAGAEVAGLQVRAHALAQRGRLAGGRLDWL